MSETERNIIQDFLDKTGITPYALAGILEIGRSTLSGWIKNKPRYPKLTELALSKLEDDVKDDNQNSKVELDPETLYSVICRGSKDVLNFGGESFVYSETTNNYHGCNRQLTGEFMADAIFHPENDAYKNLRDIIRTFRLKKALFKK